jgi:hypothetical protein
VEPHRIADGSEHNGNSGGRRLCRKRRRSGGCGNYRHLTTHQIGRHRRQPISMTFRPAVFDRHVTTIDVAFFVQTFEEGRQLRPIALGRSSVNKPNDRHRGLLRALQAAISPRHYR